MVGKAKLPKIFKFQCPNCKAKKTLSLEEFNSFNTKCCKEGDFSYYYTPLFSLGFKYIYENDRLVLYNLKEYKKNSYFVTAVCEIPKIIKKSVYLVDGFQNTKQDLILYDIIAEKKNYLLSEKDLKLKLKTILQEGKDSKTSMIDLRQWFETSLISDLFNEPTIKEKWATCYGFFCNEHINKENNFILVRKFYDKNLDLINYKSLYSEDFKTELDKISYDSEEIETIIENYNSMPLSKEQGEVFKIILSSCVINWFSEWLKTKGLNERKEINLCGVAGNGKSHIMFNTFGLFGLENPFPKSIYSRQNNIKAELKNIFPSLLPTFHDEIPSSLSSEIIDLKKANNNGNKIYFERNSTTNTIDYYYYGGSLEGSTCNFLKNAREDLDDKIFCYEPKPEKITKSTIFTNSININALKIGKYIYNYLITINPETYFKFDVPLKREDKQFLRLKLGEQILQDLKILSSYSLNKTLFLESRLSKNEQVESGISIFKEAVREQIQVYNTNYSSSPYSFLKEGLLKHFLLKDMAKKEISYYEKLNSLGIFFKITEEKKIKLCFKANFLTFVKSYCNRYRKDFNFNTLSKFVQAFKFEFKPTQKVLKIQEGVFNFILDKNLAFDYSLIFEDEEDQHKKILEIIHQQKEEKLFLKNQELNNSINKEVLA